MRPIAVAAVAVVGLACVPGSPREVPGSHAGEVASQVMVDEEGRSQVLHRLRGEDGSVRQLLLPAGIELQPGSRVRVQGASAGDAIQVQRVEVLAGPEHETGARALLNGEKKPTRRWAFVLVDVDGGGNTVDKVKAQDVLFNAGRLDSIRSYFREVSHGLQDLEGDVFGPLPYAMAGRCDTDRLVKELIGQIPGKYDNYLWFFGKRQTACPWAGIADLGSAERPLRHSWYNAASACSILVQEPGHNFGMVHSSAMRCTLDGKPVTIGWNSQGNLQCLNEEYGNPFDPMGGGGCYHMNGVQKAYQDWLSGCNVVKATESGTFTIYPIESTCDGPQVLQVPFPQPRPFGKAGVLSGYYLELRAPLGRDGDLDPQVLVVVGNDVREARLTGNRNWLLDMKPETETADDSALEVGKTFADALPGGPKFTLVSVDATKAVIRVELANSKVDSAMLGTGVCSDMKAFVAPGVSNCVAPVAQPAAPPRVDGGMSGTDGMPGMMGVGGAAGGGAEMDGGSPASGSGGRRGNGTSGGSGGAAAGSPGTGSAPRQGTGGAASAPSPSAPRTGGCAVNPGAPSGGSALALLAALALASLSRLFAAERQVAGRPYFGAIRSTVGK